MDSRPGPTFAIVFSRVIVASPLSRSIHLAAAARLDIERLHDFLFEKNPDVALRLISVLQAHVEALAEFSERGRSIGDGIRELIVPFGASRYVVRYEIDARGISISRIWHSLEHR